MGKTVKTVWEVWTYDVWGNAEDGYEVNDRSCQDRHCELVLDVETCNAGTPMEFECASPSDKWLHELFGKCRLDVDGDDTAVYVTRERDGYPLGELLCVSHESLPPDPGEEGIV